MKNKIDDNEYAIKKITLTASHFQQPYAEARYLFKANFFLARPKQVNTLSALKWKEFFVKYERLQSLSTRTLLGTTTHG